ncbi:MAG: hypothetical protein JSS86_25850 [Cyanobacteria bacterium SZAS LIN-2]|nr:hypothetical protein [Cyanobacteria bacterium SZAS LIN-2]
MNCKNILLSAAIAGANLVPSAAMAQHMPAGNIRNNSGPVAISALPADSKAAPMKISGPFTSANLAVYLIHGPNKSNFQEFLTLQEGMLKGYVTVKETGEVNQLAVQNKGNLPIFIQSGDIVKGGRQDRTMQYDMILPPKSGFVPINSFCVEHGRWSKRGNEDAGAFNGSQFQLANKSLKMAAKYAGDQQQVWDMVDKFKSVGFAKARVSPAQAMASASPTSLEMALENDQVKQASGKYVQDLQNIVKDKSDVVGYAFAINGKVNSIDVYANNALFKKMWPKLINSSATEAFSEADAGKKYKAPDIVAVKECIDDADRARPAQKAVSGNSRMMMHETTRNLLFETEDFNAGKSNGWIHRNYLTK